TANPSKVYNSYTAPKRLIPGINTGNNMSLGIPVSAWDILPDIGDEIGVYSPLGKLIGSAVFTGRNMAVPIWGNDMTTPISEAIAEGENYNLYLSKASCSDLKPVVVNRWEQGNGQYCENGISVIGKLTTSNIENSLLLMENFPNPCNGICSIEFSLPENANISLSIYSVSGKKVAELVNRQFEKGKHIVQLKNRGLPSGSYFIKLESERFNKVNNLQIIR
ncbi:MAG: T9SS type A sorting domain-containing protein, partial [Bacteroidota bacterium]|nr:T9SS type A sorting domain-containing protein [Bacteroidota bacterium]